MAKSTDPLVSLIQDVANAPKPTAALTTYGTPTTDAAAETSTYLSGGNNAATATKASDRQFFPALPYELTAVPKPSPDVLGGTIEVVSVKQVAGAPGDPPTAVSLYPVKGQIIQ